MFWLTFFPWGIWGRSISCVNLWPLHILGTIRAWRLNFYTHLDRVKYSFRVWKSVQWFDLGACQGKQTGQDRQKVTKALYFTDLGRSSTEPICTEICTVVAVPDVITCANFWAEIFRGYNFTGGRIFHFPIDSCMGPTTVQHYCAVCDVARVTAILDVCFSSLRVVFVDEILSGCCYDSLIASACWELSFPVHWEHSALLRVWYDREVLGRRQRKANWNQTTFNTTTTVSVSRLWVC